MNSSAPPPNAKPLRLFIAVELPKPVHAALGELQSTLRGQLPGSSRWVAAANIHLTLKFLGDVPPARVSAVADAMRHAVRGAAAFELRLAGAGLFPNERAPRVLWVGLSGDIDALLSLQQAVEDAMEQAGWPQEPLRFQPHLTLARIGDRLRPRERESLLVALGALAVPSPGPAIPVRSLSLMRSTLTPQRAVYERVAEAPLTFPRPNV